MADMHTRLSLLCPPQLASAKDQVVVVVSVSPQSRASLAARFGMSGSETGQKLTSFFKGLGQWRPLRVPS